MSLLATFLDAELTNPPPLVKAEVFGLNPVPPIVGRTVDIAIRSDGNAGSGTPDDPYNGSTVELLDGLLSDFTRISKNMTIRFGPGVFQTRGGAGPLHDTQPPEGVVGWLPQSGQKFIGSGIHQTILQLAKVKMQKKPIVGTVFGQGIPIIGTGSLGDIEGIEISDMTLDCNASRLRDADGNPLLVAPYGIAFNLVSSVALRRVRVINVNGHTPTYVNGINQSTDVDPPGIGSWEAYPIIVNYRGLPPGPLEYNSFVEECVIDQPESSPARECTRINAHTHGGLTIRNCYLNGDYTTGSPYPSVPVVKMTYTATEVTVTTKFPHNLQIRDDVWIAGCDNDSFDGQFALGPHADAPVPDDVGFKFTKIGQTGSGAVHDDFAAAMFDAQGWPTGGEALSIGCARSTKIPWGATGQTRRN